MSAWRSRDYLIEPNADRLVVAEWLTTFSNSQGYAWFERVVNTRIRELEHRMFHRITASEQTSKDAKVDLHNSNVTEYETLKDILQLVRDGISKLNERTER